MFGNLDAGGVRQKYRAIEQATAWYGVAELCKVFRVSRSGYYAYLKREVEDKDRELKIVIQEMYAK